MRKKRQGYSQTSTGIFFLLPNFLGFLAFVLIPVLASFLLSFFKCDLLQARNILTWHFIGLQNFVNLLGFSVENGSIKAHDPEFWSFLWNTLFLMLKIPVIITLSLGLALLLNRKVKGRVFFRTIYFLPTICAGTALYILWRWIFNAHFGLLNLTISKLSMGSISGPPWLVNPNWAKPSFILMNTWLEMGGINMLIYLAALHTIPRAYYEASALDGAGSWDRFRHITWPLLGPTTSFVLIINLINGFQEGFQQAHIMTQGGPAGSTTMLSYYIYKQAYVWNHMGYAAAVSWILFTVIIIVTAISWKYGCKHAYYK